MDGVLTAFKSILFSNSNLSFVHMVIKLLGIFSLKKLNTQDFKSEKVV
jgi:hypothetical protein